jgi:thiamine pyrophosphate-dependent acetolactate synthase large subunit-like protein
MIHAGSGIIHCHAYDALRRVAELLHAPVTTSWAARGMLSETSPLAITMPHVKLNHKVRNDADVVLILGSRIGETDWWGKPPYWRHPSEQKTIQVDLDADIIGLNKPADLAWWPMPGASSNCSATSWKSAQGRDQARCPPRPRRRLRQDHAGGPRRLGQGALRHGGADASGAHRRGLPAKSFRRIRCWSPTAATPPSGPCSTTA